MLADYNMTKMYSQRQLHKICHSLVTSTSLKINNNNVQPQRQQFHTSINQAVTFKSKYQVDIPKQDFFSYVLGDILGHEDKLALVCGLTGRKYTYGKLKDYCIRVGTSMLERGYRKGDVIAIYSPNVPEYIFTILGEIKFF